VHQKARVPAFAVIFWQVPGSIQATLYSRIIPAGPKNGLIALGIAIGSGYLFPTTFESEVYSDLTGERGVLMGALAGLMDAQYEVLRQNGHSPSEAFNETVEELTQSLIRLVDEKGMDWMYANCSATAQRGALDWRPKFKEATLPVFDELYKR
jgi:ketol-acid reductoisomerase